MEIVVAEKLEKSAPPTAVMEVDSDLEIEPQISEVLSTMMYSPLQIESELMVCCPHCKTLETVYFSRGEVMPAQKFYQQNQKLYHDCGSTVPCRLFHYGK